MKAALEEQRLRAEQRAKAFRNPPVPLLGLTEEWSGTRFLGGWGSSDGIVQKLALAHRAELAVESPELRIDVWAKDTPWDIPFDELQYELLARRDRSASESGDSPHAPRGAPTDDMELYEIHWEKGSIPIEGHAVDFELARINDVWGAIGSWEEVTVVVHGDKFPLGDVNLSVVRDVEPYFAGHEQMRGWFDEARQHREPDD